MIAKFWHLFTWYWRKWRSFDKALPKKLVNPQMRDEAWRWTSHISMGLYWILIPLLAAVLTSPVLNALGYGDLTENGRWMLTLVGLTWGYFAFVGLTKLIHGTTKYPK